MPHSLVCRNSNDNWTFRFSIFKSDKPISLKYEQNKHFHKLKKGNTTSATLLCLRIS